MASSRQRLQRVRTPRAGSPFSLNLLVASSLDVPTDGRVPRATETAIFRIAQEALTNVARHATATEAMVRERAHWLGGRLAIDTSPGRGMRVRADLPVQATAP